MDSLAALGYVRVPDKRSTLERAAAAFSAQERDEQREHDRKVELAHAKQAAMILALAQRGVSYNSRSLAATDLAERTAKVEELEAELKTARRAAALAQGRLTEIDGLLSEAQSVASRAQQDDLLAPAKAAWAVAQDVAAEMDLEARAAKRYERMQLEAAARVERDREKQAGAVTR